MMRFLSFFLLLFFLNLLGCRHIPTKPVTMAISDQAQSNLKSRDVSVIYVPENKHMPAHLLYQRKDRFRNLDRAQAFKLEMSVNPLMRKPHIIAVVEKNGAKQREFVAKKNATTTLSDKKTSWIPARSKLSLIVPFVQDDEEVVVTTSYEWMDIRFLQPIFLQDAGVSDESRLVVDVPYGVTMHFKTAKDGQSYDFIPRNTPHEKTLWVQQENRAGLGMRYLWQASHEQQSSQLLQSDFLQVFLSFENPTQNDTAFKLDGWEAVSRYIYDRIDRYDMPSHEIKNFATRETRDYGDVEQKIERIFSFLRKEIEKRPTSGSFQEQEIQPATRTFARRFGSPFDVAILGKALFSSMGLDADLVAVSDKTLNPSIKDFYSPAIFSSVILAVTANRKTHYFDPYSVKDYVDQMRPNLQGQHALLVRPKAGVLFTLPYDSAHKNIRTHSYQLWMSDDGVLEGEYSIDITGLETQGFAELSEDQLRRLAPDAIEARLGDVPFSLENAQILHNNPIEMGARISGHIKPKILSKSNDGAFLLDVGKIVEPAAFVIRNALQKGYSSTTRISLFINLSEHFNLKNVPGSINFHVDGISGRFSASYSNGQLIVEGLSMISLPLSGNYQEKLGAEIDKLKWFVDDQLMITNSETVVGAPDGEKESVAPENS